MYTRTRFSLPQRRLLRRHPDSKVHGANMGPTWVLSAPDGPQDGPMNLAIRAAVEDTKQHPRMNDEDTRMIRFLSEGGGTDQKAGRSQMRGWIPQGGCDWKVESNPLHWRRNGYDTVSNHKPHHCLLNRLFRRRSKKISKLCLTGLCAGSSPETGEFPAQMASDAENVSIWWRHHAICQPLRCQASIWSNADSLPMVH